MAFKMEDGYSSGKVKREMPSLDSMLDIDKVCERSKMVEYFTINKIILDDCLGSSEEDYRVYVDCMEVYANTGINYFEDYRSLKMLVLYDNIGGGIRDYRGMMDIYDNEYLYQYQRKLEWAMTLMRFFSIVNMNGLTVALLQKLSEQARDDWNCLKSSLKKDEERKEAERKDKKKEEYLNFQNFNEVIFERVYSECIKSFKAGVNTHTASDIMKVHPTLNKDECFLVFIKYEGEVVSLGRTTKLNGYMINKLQEYEVDEVMYYPVNEEYIDEVYVRANIEFKVKKAISPKTSNKKYISSSLAARLIGDIYGIEQKKVKDIISSEEIKKYYMGTRVILDKKELHVAIMKYLDIRI